MPDSELWFDSNLCSKFVCTLEPALSIGSDGSYAGDNLVRSKADAVGDVAVDGVASFDCLLRKVSAISVDDCLPLCCEAMWCDGSAGLRFRTPSVDADLEEPATKSW